MRKYRRVDQQSRRVEGRDPGGGRRSALLKTRTAMFEQLSQHVRTLHPHEVPCIIATEVSESEPAFAAWLEAETC